MSTPENQPKKDGPAETLRSGDLLGVRRSDEDADADLMVTDHETGKTHYVKSGKLTQLHAEAMTRVQNGQDAWTRLSALNWGGRAKLSAETSAAVWWVWWNSKTGGIGLGRVFGHRSHAMAESWLEKDGHELRSVRLSFSPNNVLARTQLSTIAKP